MKPTAEVKQEEQPIETRPISVVEVPTQMGLAFKLPDDKVVDLNEYLVWIGNELLDLKKQLGYS